MRLRRIAPALVLIALALALGAGAASAASTENVRVRPGVGIGKLRLGMTLQQVRHALGRDLVRIGVHRKRDTRLIEYGTRGGVWRIEFLGADGRQRVARITSSARRERTSEGIGIGSDVAAIPVRLRRFAPECRNSVPFLNFHLHRARMTHCALVGHPDGLTIFSGEPACAVRMVRYQGCTRIRVPVVAVTIESRSLALYELSRWYPAPANDGLRWPPG